MSAEAIRSQTHDLHQQIAALRERARELEGQAFKLQAEAMEARLEADFRAAKAAGKCERCRWHMIKETLRWEGACGIPVHLDWCAMGECRYDPRIEVVG